MFVSPHNQINHWRFVNEFLYAPCQAMSRFASRCETQIVQSLNDFQNIEPQVDGQDYDPQDLDIKYRPLPFVNWQSERVGFSLWGHTWNYIIPTEDLNGILPSFKTTLAQRARESWERFLDRVMAGACDLKRVTVDASNPGRLGQSDLEESNLPNRYRYINKADDDISPIQKFNVGLLKAMVKKFSAREVINKQTNMLETPVVVARHEQIYNLLDDDEFTNRDYNSLLPLTKGDVNSYMGFEFIKTATVDALDLPSTYVAGSATAVTNTQPRSSNANGFFQIDENDVDKVLFCHPYQAFAKGVYPQAGYMQVWQNPNRAGAFEYYMKQVLAYKRKQNEYVTVAYCAKDRDTSAAPGRQPGITSGNDSLNKRVQDNSSFTAGWDFTLKGPSPA